MMGFKKRGTNVLLSVGSVISVSSVRNTIDEVTIIFIQSAGLRLRCIRTLELSHSRTSSVTLQ